MPASRKNLTVVPPLAAIPQPEPLEGMLHRLEWAVLRPLASRLGGDERSIIRGFGLEMTEVREYQPGDDVRYIDWNISARTDQTYVRESHVERGLDVWLLLDTSASVDWGTARCTKRDLALEFVGAVGQLLERRGNRLGMLMFADRPLETIPPGAGRKHLLKLLHRVREQPRQSARRDSAGPDLAAILSQAYKVIQRRALIIIISDFLTPDGWQTVLGQIALRHEVVAVCLRDPRESELPDVGLITLEDPETGRQMTINTRDRKLRERFRQAAQAQSESLKTSLAACGVEQLTLSTDGDLLLSLVQFLQTRHARHLKPGQRPALSGSGQPPASSNQLRPSNTASGPFGQFAAKP